MIVIAIDRRFCFYGPFIRSVLSLCFFFFFLFLVFFLLPKLMLLNILEVGFFKGRGYEL